MKRIACIGEAMIELSMTDDAALVGVAGDTLNTAIYLHRTAPSLNVDYVTCLGDDPFSARINDFIAREGVGTSAVRTVPGASPGLYAITTRPDGERSFTYWRNTSAARQLFDDGDFSVLSSYDAVYLTGISLAILPHAVRKSLLAWLEASSITVIYDSNYRPRLWDSEAHAREITTAFWQRADIALPSLDDEMALFGETADEVIARFNRLSATGALKRGAAGPISLGIPVEQTYQRASTVVDTTGAGDSFNGGYLGCYFLGLEHFACLEFGHLYGSCVVGSRGAIIGSVDFSAE